MDPLVVFFIPRHRKQVSNPDPDMIHTQRKKQVELSWRSILVLEGVRLGLKFWNSQKRGMDPNAPWSRWRCKHPPWRRNYSVHFLRSSDPCFPVAVLASFNEMLGQRAHVADCFVDLDCWLQIFTWLGASWLTLKKKWEWSSTFWFADKSNIGFSVQVGMTGIAFCTHVHKSRPRVVFAFNLSQKCMNVTKITLCSVLHCGRGENV